MDELPVFSISPNPAAMHLTQPLIDGVARIKRAIQRRQGLCMILGDIGLGKSTLLRHVASNYDMDPERYAVSYLHDSRKCKTPFDFLKLIGEDFGITPKRSQIQQMSEIERVAGENYEAQKITIVFVDEAQKLPLETLELIRSLLNYETETHKLVQFVLAGQLELRDRLLRPKYDGIRSRLVANVMMQPFSLPETTKMIQARLDTWAVPNPFTSGAIENIQELSEGVPRRILLLCQQSFDRVIDSEAVPTRKVEAEDVGEASHCLRIEDQETIAKPATA